MFARINDDPNNPIMYASFTFTKYEGCIIVADVKELVIISGGAICIVLPSRETVEKISVKLAKAEELDRIKKCSSQSLYGSKTINQSA